jgi:hypothetical protein
MSWDHHALQQLGHTCLIHSQTQIFVPSSRLNFTRSFNHLSLGNILDELFPHPSDEVIAQVKDDTPQKRMSRLGKKSATSTSAVVAAATSTVTKTTKKRVALKKRNAAATKTAVVTAAAATTTTTKKRAAKKRKATATPAWATKKGSACGSDTDWT